MLKRRTRQRNEKRCTHKLRNMLGEKDSLSDDDENSANDSEYSSGMSSGFHTNNDIDMDDYDVENERLRARRTSNNKSNDLSEYKGDECTVENAEDNHTRQRGQHEECIGMNELTKGIENTNDAIKSNKDTNDLYCRTSNGLVVVAEKIAKLNVDSLVDVRNESAVDLSCSTSQNGQGHRRRENGNRLVKRKNNMFYQEGSLDSGPGERAKSNAIDSTTVMNNNHNRNNPSGTSDGLLNRFGERQSSGIARKRQVIATTSELDFERKMGSPRSSRSSSLHSYSSSVPASIDSGLRMGFQEPHSSVVVVAIDFGTTFSGYAFSFTRDPGSIHMMRKWEGGDPGVNNQKIPTTLLLRPDGSFYSFGYGARDFYHDLEHSQAKKWLYFEKFKMSLHSSEDLNPAVLINAANGKPFPAWKVFAHALRFFKEHVLTELSDQSTARIFEEDITWVLTVPAIWRQPAKQFMRTAAHEAGIASWDCPERLLIALEPEAASIFCRKMRIRDCIIEDDVRQRSQDDSLISEDFVGATQYVVVDCGGGTVDLTVHELDVSSGTLKELHRGTGGACGATGIDAEFEKLMKRIFDTEFIEKFKAKRPASWVDLIIAFESKKRTARPGSQTALNITLPYSFIDYYKKKKRSTVETAIKKLKNPDIKWSSQGMLRIAPAVMEELFKPVLEQILNHVRSILQIPELADIRHLFLVGGFAESPLLQEAIRNEFRERVRVVIPHDVGLTILKGAVLFGLDPTVVRVRRSALTYGVGVLNKFNSEKHDESKKVIKDDIVWCKDILDKFVCIDDSVGLGDTVTRSYAPARAGQKSTVINIYCSESKHNQYTTDRGVRRCGQIRIEMPSLTIDEIPEDKRNKPRELQATMLFGDTELKVTAVDVLTGKSAKSVVDFLNY